MNKSSYCIYGIYFIYNLHSVPVHLGTSTPASHFLLKASSRAHLVLGIFPGHFDMFFFLSGNSWDFFFRLLKFFIYNIA